MTKSKPKELARVGLTLGSPAEVVVTTFSSRRKPHAAVMGVRRLGGKVGLRVFTDTRTFKNLLGSKAAVINVVGDAELLARIALGGILGRPRLKFTHSRRVEAPRLKGAEAYVEVEVERIELEKVLDEVGSSEVAQVLAQVKHVEVVEPRPKPFKRPEFFLVEAAILATRIKKALENHRLTAAKKLLKELEGYASKCRRVAPDSKELKLLTRVEDLLKTEVKR